MITAHDLFAGDVMKSCTVDGCGEKHKGRGLCNKHLIRLRKTGTTDSPVRSQEERFWAKVDRRGPDECWEWTGALTTTGYGALRPAGQHSGPVVKAHRYSAELAGMNPEGRFVLHSCDNSKCVNPAHLRLGDHDENMRDMVQRGRQVGTRKIAKHQIEIICAKVSAGALHREVAAEYGVSRPTITRIVNGNAVTPPAARDLGLIVAEALDGGA